MSKQIFFIAGTDTDAGKTHAACQLLRATQQRGLHTLGLKPLAAGAENSAEGLRNADVLLLQQWDLESKLTQQDSVFNFIA